MNSNRFVMEALSEVDFHISYVEIDALSSMNQHEAHVHNECEIYLNLSGDVFFEVENRIYPISRGSVIITRPYEYHHCVYRSNLKHSHYWITFSTQGAQEYLNLFFERTKGQDNLIRLSEEQLKRLCSMLDQLLKRETGRIRQRICFLEVLDILLSGNMSESIGSVQGLSSYVQAALKFMEVHLTENIGIKEMADAAGVSVNTLERHFKETFGTSPIAILRRKRLVESTMYLRNRSTVSEAAMRSGFADYSNYIQLFRQHYGMTPLQYKKKFEEAPQS